MTIALLLLACAVPPTTDSVDPEGPTPEETDTPDDAPPADSDDVPTDTPDPLCPAGMALVDDAFCVDRWEATLEVWDGASWTPWSPYDALSGQRVRAATPAPDRVPQGYVSGDEAAAACAEAGRRLCTSAEWLAACQGPSGWTWPYGPTHQDGACNDHYDGGHPVVDLFGYPDVWDAAHMNDPRINQQPGTVAAGGAFSACASAWGVYDQHGNLHEWVDDPDGTFRGGFYADAAINGEGCTYRTTAHGRSYHDYSTGFRCCADPR
jgi:sulfatase modifying factor 1